MPKSDYHTVMVRIPLETYHWLADHQEAQRDAWKAAHPGQHPHVHAFTVQSVILRLLHAYREEQSRRA